MQERERERETPFRVDERLKALPILRQRQCHWLRKPLWTSNSIPARLKEKLQMASLDSQPLPSVFGGVEIRTRSISLPVPTALDSPAPIPALSPWSVTRLVSRWTPPPSSPPRCVQTALWGGGAVALGLGGSIRVGGLEYGEAGAGGKAVMMLLFD